MASESLVVTKAQLEYWHGISGIFASYKSFWNFPSHHCNQSSRLFEHVESRARTKIRSYKIIHRSTMIFIHCKWSKLNKQSIYKYNNYGNIQIRVHSPTPFFAPMDEVFINITISLGLCIVDGCHYTHHLNIHFDTYFEAYPTTLSGETLSGENFVRRNYWSGEIFVTKRKIRHFRPTKSFAQ